MPDISILRRLLLVGTSAIALSVGVAACDQGTTTNDRTTPTETTSGAETTAQTEGERLRAFFEAAYQEGVARSPMRQSYLGIKTEDYGKWDDLSAERAEEDHQINQRYLADLAQFDYDALNEDDQLSYRLFKALTQRAIDDYKWRHYRYPINQMFGWQSTIPSFLINIHRVTSLSDAEYYISRLNAVGALADGIIDLMKASENAGVVPPKFVFPLVIESSRNVISGAPFDERGTTSPVYEDFSQKVGALAIADEEKEQLLARAGEALVEVVAPAYERMIAEMERQQDIAMTDDGAWKFPDGDRYYAAQLKNYTTTDLTPQEVHQIGLDNVARIHDEMREIMKTVNFDGDLADFFEFMRTDDQFYYDNTDEGRERYLAEATHLIDVMRTSLPEVFGIFPEADVVVKRVEPFRERSAGKAFYQVPALDGSRPGTYYANLYNMRDMPTYQMEALAYHEGIPGHHMQLAIAQELDDVPMFQKMSRFTAYTEGWGLYSELLPKEMGFYDDPYSDFGRLAMELWRACRLVVDTGLHFKKWTREEAIDYLKENTPNSEGDIVKSIERYIVMPGQATAYMIGKEKILELREKAHEKLGDSFDLRAYHDEVLKDGPVPLDILEEKIDAWVARVQQAG